MTKKLLLQSTFAKLNVFMYFLRYFVDLQIAVRQNVEIKNADIKMKKSLITPDLNYSDLI
jgi:hypothetical protein